MKQPKLIVLDDDPDLATFIQIVGEQAGYDVAQFNDAEKFKQQFNGDADAIALDLVMPGVDGIEVIRFLSGIECEAVLVLMSGFDSGVLHSAQMLAMAQGLNVAGSLNKPFHYDELFQLLIGISARQKIFTRNLSSEPPSVDELRDGLEKGELVVYFQPKVGLNGDTSKSVEALIRWRHPELGLVDPEFFIPTAERHGLIDDLTDVVMKQALQQCRAWRDQGLSVQIAVNMSAITLKDLSLPEKLGGLVQSFGLKPSQIILEVTESALMGDLTTSLDILTRLRMKGFLLSIDDFGTGYSSLVQLHRAPFSEIKIDSSFVKEMEKDPEAATIVENIIMLGHKLNMKVVAEGVETESCKEKLIELSCDLGQGFLFACPMPGSEVMSWFTQHRPN